MNLDKIFDVVINKLHILLACVAHGALLAYTFHTGHDTPPGIQNCEFGFLAFLGGHALTYQLHPDKDNDHGDKG